MNSEATPRLTDHAAFWVVRPRLSAGSISGLETIVSGAYIEFDPGEPGGKKQREFVGLEQPPGVRSDEPGSTFTLTAQRLGSLSEGAPVFYRDLPVGEVLSHDQPGLSGPIGVRVFIRKPFDSFVRQDTHFWNVSGLSVQLGPQGVHVEIASLQAVLSGGVAFLTPGDAAASPPAKPGTVFPLYADFATAMAAGLTKHIHFVVYTQDDVSGLSRARRSISSASRWAWWTRSRCSSIRPGARRCGSRLTCSRSACSPPTRSSCRTRRR